MCLPYGVVVVYVKTDTAVAEATETMAAALMAVGPWSLGRWVLFTSK